MTDRAAAMRRILAVQQKMHRLAQWKLGELQREDAALRQRQEELLRFAGSTSLLADLMADAVTKRLRHVGETRHLLQDAQAKQSDKVLAEAGRAGRAARLLDTLEKEQAREAEQHDLAEIIEAMIARRPEGPLPD